MNNMGHQGAITLVEESINRNGREILKKPISATWEGYLAKAFQEIAAATIWIPQLSEPLLLGIDIIPDKYRTLFTKHKQEDLKTQYTPFAEYLDQFIQSIPFLKYLTSQVNYKTRKIEKSFNQTYTQAKTQDIKEKSACIITYKMDRSKKRLFEITLDYSKHLKTLGPCGKNLAKTLQRLNQEEEEALWGFWDKDTPPLWLRMLYKSFLEDCFEKKKAELLPAITRETMDKGLKRLIQEKSPVIHINDRHLEYFSEKDKRSLGYIPLKSKDLPNVQPDIIPIIKAGGKMVGSFMSHKLLHFENKLFYDRWNNNEKDFRKVSIEGGYVELARKLGYAKNGRSIENLKKILYFQAAFWFTLSSPDGGSKTGNLITLTEHKNKFGEIGQLDIIAGSMLTPEAVYTASKEEGGSLLIPFVDLPEKMLGNPATWGGQAFLQMLLLEYLTINSREFVGKESVRITKKDWEMLILEAKLPHTFVKRLKDIQKLFCCPEQGFLDIQGEECSFNKRNEKAAKHLLAQGQLREKRAKQAKKAHTKRK